ncbi:MAG TPA: T9SS type B sorting domain-containing protein, partial [Bacteroidetes bacterium]|nr:T9SS type B sorting domain-containing protein [Bacteroidota bacterium]
NANGAIDLTVTGGTTPYTFSWSNGAASEDLSGLSGGNYTVNITDANGCTTSATYTVNEPAALAASASVTDVDCNGNANGAIDLTVTGGTTPYTFSWSNGQTSEDLSSIPAGEYTVLVTDANGCQKDTSFSVTEPEAIVITATITDVMCHGENNGIIDVTVSGGISPYTYNWSTGEATEDLSGLSAGSYTLNVTDGNGCRESSSFTISEPDSLSLSASVTDAVCHGDNNGSIDLSVTGGTSPYSFVWDNGATSEDISGLTAGTYKVAVSDANACHSNISVTVSEPDQLTVSSTITDAECPDMPDGSIQLSADGGTSPYNFTWSNGMSGDNIDHLTAGSYSVTVIDMNQCSLDTTFTVGFSRTSCLDIPTVITPNGDGHNDTWRIRNIELYPHVRIEIFTRWGKLVFHSEEGYPNPWDGRYKGKLLPMDSYHYIIDLGNGSSPITGNITIVR